MFHRSVSFTTPPNLAGLDSDSPAAILAVELVRIVEGVQDEWLHRLAELAVAARGEHPDALVGGAV
jgi:hypothetical protein